MLYQVFRLWTPSFASKKAMHVSKHSLNRLASYRTPTSFPSAWEACLRAPCATAAAAASVTACTGVTPSAAHRAVPGLILGWMTWGWPGRDLCRSRTDCWRPAGRAPLYTSRYQAPSPPRLPVGRTARVASGEPRLRAWHQVWMPRATGCSVVCIWDGG